MCDLSVEHSLSKAKIGEFGGAVIAQHKTAKKLTDSQIFHSPPHLVQHRTQHQRFTLSTDPVRWGAERRYRWIHSPSFLALSKITWRPSRGQRLRLAYVPNHADPHIYRCARTENRFEPVAKYNSRHAVDSRKYQCEECYGLHKALLRLAERVVRRGG